MQGYYSVFALYSYIVYTMQFIFILITVLRVYLKVLLDKLEYI